MAGRSLMKIFRTIILLSLFCTIVHYLINKKSFIFSPREVKTIAEKYIGQHPTQSQAKLLGDIRRKYSSHVLPPTDPNWFTLSAGGLRTKIFLIHVSMTEYMAIIGSPMSTAGHAGFHWMNQSCTVLTGSLQRFKDGPQLTREDFGPGEHVRFGMFEGSVVEFSDETWLLCYGRGFVPATAPYVTLNALTSSVDPLSPAQLLFTCTRSMGREFYLWFQDLYHYYVAKLSK